MMKYLFVLTALLFIGCDWSSALTIDQWNDLLNPPDSIVVPPQPPDTCAEYFPVDTPSFVQGFVEFDMGIPSSGWIIYAGPNSDTIFPGEESLLDDKIAAVSEAYQPQFEHISLSRPDARRADLIIKGTDNTASNNLKVWFRTQYAKVYMTFSKRYLCLAGSATVDEFVALGIQFPSVRGWNLRDLDADSLGERKVMLSMLGHCKKVTGGWADFRFNSYEPGDSIVTAFDDAGWNTLTNFNSSPAERAATILLYLNGSTPIGYMRPSGTVDARGFDIDEAVIFYLLEQGHQVITDL